MSGETGASESGWTVDTLFQHLHQQMQAQQEMLNERHAAQQLAMQTALTAAEKAVERAMQAAEKAVNKAEIAADKRFELLNELREGVATREQLDALEKQVDDLKSRVDRSEGRGAGLNASWVYLLAGIAALGTIVSIYLAISV